MITKAYNRIKEGIIWIKNNPKKAVLILLGIGFVSAAPALFPGTTEENKNVVADLVFNGKTISFPYTDDNTGETLIIKTDQETYSSWDSAYVYFAVKNITNDDQDTKIQFAYDGGASTSKIEEYKPQVAYQVEEPVYETKTYECKEGWEELIEGLDIRYTCKGDPKTARFCDSVDKTICTVDNEQTGTTLETRYRDEWGTITKDVVEDLKSKDVKPIDVKFVPKEQVTYWIPAGATKYFRAKIVFNPKSNGEFYINAYGHLNATGHLDPFYDSAWGYRRQITLDYTKVATTTALTGFPLMFSTSTIADLKFTGSGGKVGKSDGTDILVTESDGTTKLSHQLEFYSSSTGETVLHFKSSTSTPLSTSTNTSYYLYYGNAAASDQQDVANVWDSNYLGVWHLAEGDSTSADFYADSTSNNQDGTLVDSDGDSTSINGKIYNAIDFNGDTDYVDTVPVSGMLTADQVSVSAWIRIDNYPDSGTQYLHAIATTQFDSVPNAGWGLYLGQFNVAASIQNLQFLFRNAANNAWVTTSVGSTELSLDTWYHVVATYDQSNAYVYVNGSQDANVSSTVGINDPTDFKIGSRSNVGRYWDGGLQEIRVSNIARSASWILTEYNNQNSPDTFWSVGAEETDTPATGDAPGTIYLKGDAIFKGDVIIK